MIKEIETVSLSDYIPLPDGEMQYSTHFIEENSALVLGAANDAVIIGLCNPEDRELQYTLTHFHEKRIHYKRIDHDELSEYLGKLHAGVDTHQEYTASIEQEKLMLDKIANDAPIINFVNSTIIEAIRKRASDIHIEAFTDTVKVRYRIDGVLQIMNTISLSMFPAISSRLKIMSNLNIMERRLPQDGRASVHLGGDTQDIRVSIVPTAKGESIVLRLFNRKSAPIELNELGFRDESLYELKRILKTPYGLILATGPTGSGKTTTLNSMLREMDRESQKIITVEDPIEYVINGIDQIQTNEVIGLTFNSILKRILRQDPNVIMVGEIRDVETARLCIRAALTGHLVLSTLHTNDSVSVIDRLRDMGVEPFMIAAVLKTSMAQRLVRKLCPVCRIKQKPNNAGREVFHKMDRAPEYVYEAGGCDKCNGTGYYGRILLHEYFSWDEEIERMIATDAKHSDIQKYLNRIGMVSLFHDGLLKVEQGITTLAELEKVMSS